MRHAFLVLLLAFLLDAAFGQNVTVAGSMAKIHPSEGPTSTNVAEIHAAQNEFEAFQLIVTGPATGVSATVNTLLGPAGATIPAGEVRLYREAYLNITTPSNSEGGAGMWPDALVPDIDDLWRHGPVAGRADGRPAAPSRGGHRRRSSCRITSLMSLGPECERSCDSVGLEFCSAFYQQPGIDFRHGLGGCLCRSLRQLRCLRRRRRSRAHASPVCAVHAQPPHHPGCGLFWSGKLHRFELRLDPFRRHLWTALRWNRYRPPSGRRQTNLD